MYNTMSIIIVLYIYICLTVVHTPVYLHMNRPRFYTDNQLFVFIVNPV